MKVRHIVHGPRAAFDLQPRSRRRREYSALRRFAQSEAARGVTITLSLTLRLMRSAMWQMRQQRRMKNSNRYYRWFDHRYRQMKLGVRKEMLVVPKW